MQVNQQYDLATDVPKEIDAFWHNCWAEYMNEHHRQAFLNAGLAGYTFTERAPDAPNGQGGYNFGFRADGSFEFRDCDGDAILEWDSYKLAYRALGDPSYDPTSDIAAGRCRYTKNPEHFLLAMEMFPVFREALKVAIAETEQQYKVELPKFW